MASLGMARANDAWRTAGRLWMALEPMGHARRCCHRGFDARRLLARDSAEYEIVRRPATSTVVGARLATFCGCWRRSAEGACLAELAKREDSCLNIIVLPSASGGRYFGGCWVRDSDEVYVFQSFGPECYAAGCQSWYDRSLAPGLERDVSGWSHVSRLPLRLPPPKRVFRALPLYASTLTLDNLTFHAKYDNVNMPAMVPPPGFVDLATAQGAGKYSLVSFIGVVVDYLPPRQSAGSDFSVTFKLQDHSMRYSGEGLKVRFFRKRLEDLPTIKAIGDVVLLRNMKVGEYAGETVPVSCFQTGHLVFSAPVVPSPAFKLDYVGGNGKLPCQGTDGLRNALGPVEQDYIITLKSELNIQIKPVDVPAPLSVAPGARNAQPAPPGLGYASRAASNAYSKKFKLVKDLEESVFSDICVEVVKKFPNQFGQCELYVTDYTANKDMFYYAPPEEKKNSLVRDGDQFGYNGPPKRDWPGPYGYLVFKVTLVDPHASFAREHVSEGDMIALENVKLKVMPNSNRLEGDMWPDQNNYNKVQVRHLPRQRKEIMNLLLRKSEYQAGRQALIEELGKVAEDVPARTKGEKKKERKRKRLEAQEKAEALQQQTEAAAVRYIPHPATPSRLKDRTNTIRRKIEANKHIRCTYKDQPLTTISSILDEAGSRHTNTLPDGTSYTLPFVNARYHIKARVVDFYPPNLQDFAIQLLESEADDEKSEFSMDMTWNASTPNWEWSFALQVEEVTAQLPKLPSASAAAPRPPSRMWLNVSHLEAQHLFGNAVDDPTDLREDATLLNQLREKLYILWGDLEEQKRNEDAGERKAKRAKLDDGETEESKQPSNLPFSCCLQEYGALREGGRADEVADWERQFMISGVTIN
jgi:protection-of-telomeres protein 1